MTLRVFGQKYQAPELAETAEVGGPGDITDGQLDAIIDESFAELQNREPEEQETKEPEPVEEPASETQETPDEDTTETPSRGDATQKGDDDESESADESPKEKLSGDEEELINTATELGFSAEEVDGFETAEELQRAVTLMGRRFVDQAHQAAAYAEEQKQQPTATTEAEPATEPRETAPVDVKPEEIDLETVIAEADERFRQDVEQLEENGYDEEAIQRATYNHQQLQETRRQSQSLLQMVKTQQQQMEGYGRHFAEQAEDQQNERQRAAEDYYRQEVGVFYQQLDAMDHPELFGDEKAATDEQSQNIGLVYQNLGAIADGMRAEGRNVQLNKSLVELAVRVSFAMQIDHKTQAGKTRRVQRQANQVRTPGQRSKGKAESMPYTDDPATDPVMLKWRADAIESGGLSE